MKRKVRVPPTPEHLRMKVLVACEFSGVVRDAFIEEGHDAWSCDLLPTEGKYAHRHIQGDVLPLLNQGWDLIVAHPPCTYLASSGLHWNKRVPGRAQKTEEALEFVRMILEADCPRIALENPIGKIGTAIRKANQQINPWEFGHPESKRTCLWLKNLPPLVPTNILPMPACGYWSNQTPSRQNKLGPSVLRWMERSRTYGGIARAMARQWGQLGPYIQGDVLLSANKNGGKGGKS